MIQLNMKTKEELNQLKTEYETLTTKLKELTEDELRQVTGGYDPFEKLGLEVNQNISDKD